MSLCYFEEPIPKNVNGYDCKANSPCAGTNTVVNGYLYPHVEKSKFVQCDAFGVYTFCLLPICKS